MLESQRWSILGAGLVIAALSLLRGEAAAGSKSTNTVNVNPSFRYAYGSLGSARNSANNTEYIGCYTYSENGYTELSCRARNAAGARGNCVSVDPEFVALARSIGSDSYVEFDWDADGYCTFFAVENDSSTPPKAP